MCGRFSLASHPDTLAEQFELHEVPDLKPRFNIAPSTDVPVVRTTDAEAPREMVLVRWGLVPWWADDPSIGNRMINARSETVDTTPAFRDAFKERRCLVPADGFYEWQKVNGGKQPYHIRIDPEAPDAALPEFLRGDGDAETKRPDLIPMAFAGLWERWRDEDGNRLLSCTILTTKPNDLIRPIHDRMPVVVGPQDYARWLDPRTGSKEDLQDILKPPPPAWLRAVPVSTKVNRPENDGPELLEPVEPPAVQQDMFEA